MRKRGYGLKYAFDNLYLAPMKHTVSGFDAGQPDAAFPLPPVDTQQQSQQSFHFTLLEIPVAGTA